MFLKNIYFDEVPMTIFPRLEQLSLLSRLWRNPWLLETVTQPR